MRRASSNGMVVDGEKRRGGCQRARRRDFDADVSIATTCRTVLLNVSAQHVPHAVEFHPVTAGAPEMLGQPAISENVCASSVGGDGVSGRREGMWGKGRTFGDDTVEAVGAGDGPGGLVAVVIDLVVGERSGEPARLREDGRKEEEPR